MTDRHRNGAGNDEKADSPSPNEDTVQTIALAVQALSERQAAMALCVNAARQHMADGEEAQAAQLIARFLEQKDRAREIADQLRALMEQD